MTKKYTALLLSLLLLPTISMTMESSSSLQGRIISFFIQRIWGEPRAVPHYEVVIPHHEVIIYEDNTHSTDYLIEGKQVGFLINDPRCLCRFYMQDDPYEERTRVVPIVFNRGYCLRFKGNCISPEGLTYRDATADEKKEILNAFKEDTINIRGRNIRKQLLAILKGSAE